VRMHVGIYIYMLVFYVGHILDDKNTLCNGCNLNRMISFYSESSCNMGSVHFKSCD
jgi:hypothetical protein